MIGMSIYILIRFSMHILKIIKHPEKILGERSLEIKDVNDNKIQRLILEMIITMNDANGVGLDGPQVNKKIRIIIVSTKKGPIACINPEIIKKSFFKEWMEEGCLSVPGIYGVVKRYRSVTVKFTNNKGMPVIIKTYGLLSQIFQHEIDHINGTLFIKKAKNIRKAS